MSLLFDTETDVALYIIHNHGEEGIHNFKLKADNLEMRIGVNQTGEEVWLKTQKQIHRFILHQFGKLLGDWAKKKIKFNRVYYMLTVFAS